MTDAPRVQIAELKKLKVDREELGVNLYGIQQQLAKQQVRGNVMNLGQNLPQLTYRLFIWQFVTMINDSPCFSDAIGDGT